MEVNLGRKSVLIGCAGEAVTEKRISIGKATMVHCVFAGRRMARAKDKYSMDVARWMNA
jgi:hypothetical protein